MERDNHAVLWRAWPLAEADTGHARDRWTRMRPLTWSADGRGIEAEGLTGTESGGLARRVKDASESEERSSHFDVRGRLL